VSPDVDHADAGRNHPSPSCCPLYREAVELIGRRWTGAIIYILLKGRRRFAGLRAAIPGITDRMLSERLQELEEEAIIERIVIPETPVRVEYALTSKGRALARPFDAIGRWAHEWMGAGLASPEHTAFVAALAARRSG